MASYETKRATASHAIKRGVSTLHRESEITLETPDTAGGGLTVSQNGSAPKMNGRIEASPPLPKNEFERRLLLAKKGRKAPLPDVSRIEWYHPGISRHIAESLLLSKELEDGTYLLRDSATTQDSLTLSVRCRNSVKHYRVTWDGKQFCFGLGKFPSADALAEHFENQPIISGQAGVLMQLNCPYPHGISEPAIYDETRFHQGKSSELSSGSVRRSSDLSINSKEGFLTKLGFHRKNWKRRWFVLYRNELKYYNSEGDTVPLRVIQLEDTSHIERDQTAGKNFCFRIVTSYRTFFMFASSELEADEWVEILRWKVSCLHE